MKLCVCRSCSENGKITSELDKIAGQVEKQNPQLAAKIDEISDILDGVVKPEIKWDLRPLDGFYGNVRVLGNRIKKMGRKKHQPPQGQSSTTY